MQNELVSFRIGTGVAWTGCVGYVALYHFLPSIDTVFVLAIRSQREAGYGRED